MTTRAQTVLQGYHVGCTGIAPNAQSYFEIFSALEYQQSFFYPPRGATLARLRAQAPEQFVFAVRAWQLITHEATDYRLLPTAPRPEELGGLGHFRESPGVKRATERLLVAAAALEARAVVFETPASFSPSASNRAQMSQYFETLPRGGRLMVWDPQGIWSATEILAMCRDLDLLPVLDPLDDPPEGAGPIAYFKERGLGRPHALKEHELDRIAGALQQFETAICIFDSAAAPIEAERLAGLLQGLGFSAGLY